MLLNVYILIIPALLFVAALFAAAEAALFSLSRPQLEGLRASKHVTYERIRNLLFQPENLLSTFIVGNEFVNIMMGTFLVSLLESMFQLGPRTLAAVSVLVSSALLLTFSEIMPKLLAFRFPVLTASILVYPLSFAHLVLTPARRIFLGLSGRLLRLIGLKPAPPSVLTERDFLALVEEGAESGTLEREEKERIANVFRFSDMTVSSVMTPWQKVFYISESVSVEQALQQVTEKRFSRIPVVSSDGERVVGILYSKELLRFRLENESPDISIQSAILPPYIVSSHVKVSRLFRAFRQKKVHLALVVDEFGKQVGLVTLEDLLTTLFRTQPKRSEAQP